ncbi:MAG: hypothetical protein CL685_00345 [Candidatus Magasanikbacteria bacterium]|nr:hypothetical protein [Candidatus Magasanikbacteria bacterium]|tara:strand:+ start:4398 stop:5546 length:1149 start_codon:yes stop_codon:yes gene_type:complete
MIIGIDIRSLMSAQKTGVGEYTYELLRALFTNHPEHKYILFANAYTKQSLDLPKYNPDQVDIVFTRIPNKVLNASLLLLQYPKLDTLLCKKTKGNIKKLDYFFSPNIGFCALSATCKQVLTIHDLSFVLYTSCLTKKRQLWHYMLQPKKQCQRADIIITPSYNTKRDVEDVFGIKKEKVHVLYPGLSHIFYNTTRANTIQIKEKYHLPKKYILFLGTIEPRKNILRLISAYTKSNIRKNGYALLIAGSIGWKCKDVLQKIGNTKGVSYIDYIPEADKPGIYTNASLFVYPSLYEGFGFPVVEAMAMGVSVITSNRSSLPEVVGDAAYLVNPNNEEEIALGIKQLLFSEELAQRGKEMGKKHAQKYSWNATASQFLTYLKQQI